VLAGAAALQFLSEAACASVQHVTLAHMPHTAVLGALPALQRHQRLRALTLDSVEGLSLLPQLHALLPLLPASGAGAGGGGSGARLRHLSIAGSCPICGLVLLRPYVAFRCARQCRGPRVQHRNVRTLWLGRHTAHAASACTLLLTPQVCRPGKLQRRASDTG
jgi:hypothetical protein